MATIVSGIEFNINKNLQFTKPKISPNGRKSIGILNKDNMKSLYISTPLMLTWGVNEYTEDRIAYDMALQFPNDEYNNEHASVFLKNMQALELKIKESAVENSKDWLNKSKLTPEAVDALWTPMLKYPKDKATEEPDYSRAPTLKVKIPFWEGEFKNVELYNESKEMVFPNENADDAIANYIVKGYNIATIIQCGGIWVANGKFGVTWKLFQAVVKPKTTLSGKCHVMLSEEDREQISSQKLDDDVDVDEQPTTVIQVDSTRVEDSDDDTVEQVKEEVKQEVVKAKQEEKVVEVEDQPKKKKIVKKKPVASTETVG